MKKKRYAQAAMICLIFLLIGIVWQQIMERSDEKRYPATGSYINMSSYNMHYVSRGDGETVIVFVTGSGTPCAYTDFYYLQSNLSSLGQTISFDHAGSGWSTSTELPRTVENLESELATMLDGVAEAKPVVLICHSLGALESIYFAQKNPERVKGIVFLDSGSPEFYAADSEISAVLLNRGVSVLRATGALRLLDKIGAILPLYGENSRNQSLPADIQGMDMAMFNRFAGNPETLNAVKLMHENASTLLEMPRLGDIPILVLSSDHGADWTRVQEQLAAWSSDSRQMNIENASHYIHWSNEEAVIGEIRNFIGELER